MNTTTPAILYFIPTEKRAASSADFAEVGIDYAIDGGGAASIYTTEGPAGGNGLICAPGAIGADVRYKPDEQTWRKSPNGKCWIGVEKKTRPGPEQLARKVTYEGSHVRLRDGNEWLIPRCVTLLADRPCPLPRIFDLADDGSAITREDPRYTDLCKSAYALWSELTGATGAEPLTFAQQINLAADALAVNYRISRVESIGLLSLFGTNEMIATLRAMIDLDEIDARVKARAEKKTTEAASESNT